MLDAGAEAVLSKAGALEDLVRQIHAGCNEFTHTGGNESGPIQQLIDHGAQASVRKSHRASGLPRRWTLR